MDTDRADHHLEDALANLHDAGMLRVPPYVAAVTALAAVRPGSIGEAIDWLQQHRDVLEKAYAEAKAGPLRVSELRPEMRYEPELAGLDRSRNDHALREKYLFADLVGRASFFQAAVYAITGIELSPSDAELLDQLGVANIAADQRAWPMAVTRRVAANGGGLAHALTAGYAMLTSPVIAGMAAADCARFLREVRERVSSGERVPAIVDGVFAQHRRVMGFGRPVVGPDERCPVMEAIAKKYGRDQGTHVTLLREVEAEFVRHRGLKTTAAAWAAAIMSDLGFSPDGVNAVSTIYLNVCFLAQATYSSERAIVERPPADPG